MVLRYENGAPALVEAEVGRGRVLLLTTTVDREWTDLPIRPGFLPLVQESDAISGRRPLGRRGRRHLLVGERRELALGADDRRLEIMPAERPIAVAAAAGTRRGHPRAARGLVHRDR